MFFFLWLELSCNFEEGMCGWYQDNSDNFDWTMHQGNDHTIGRGNVIWKSTVHIKKQLQLALNNRKPNILNMLYKISNTTMVKQ